MENLIIIGSGITGLSLGFQLKSLNPLLLDKGKGVGGRLATRRTDRSVFDHGAQFYIGRPELSALNDFWFEKKVSTRWYQSASGNHYRGTTGMTALAKALAAEQRVELDSHVDRIAPSDDETFWNIFLKNGKTLSAREIVFTAPLPQSLLLLQASGIPYSSDLDQIDYAKALVGLFELDGDESPEFAFAGYDEPKSDGIYSMTDQKIKGISRSPAWTIVMDPEWSERFFDKDDDTTLREIRRIIEEKWEVPILSQQLKKWRYSHPLRTHAEKFVIVSKSPSLVLAGDAFGGPSIQGAVRSAFAVSAWYKNRG